MRIELPNATWNDAAHRAHDDAHTLTLPQLPLSLAERLLPWADSEQTHRVAVPHDEARTLTLTL
jgi:hypothetical protein